MTDLNCRMNVHLNLQKDVKIYDYIYVQSLRAYGEADEAKVQLMSDSEALDFL